MRRWRHWDWDWGRWSASIDLSSFNRPSIHVHGEGEDYAYAAINYGSPGADPALRLEVNLEGTRLGRIVAWCGWQWRKQRWWER